MFEYLQELWGGRELLANLTMREVKGKYRRTLLGQLWSLINPLATMLVYTIVFSLLFRADPPPGDPSGLDIYPVWLMCGLLPWTFFTRVINGSMAALMSGATLIKKVYFPRVLLPFSMAGSDGFTWLNEMGLLAVVILICGGWVIPWLPLTLVFMVFLALFATGLGMMFAILNVYFRDTEHFVGIALRLMMYLTPVMYPLTRVSGFARGDHSWVLTVFELNPMEHFMQVFRNLLYDNRLPTISDSLWCICSAVVAFAVGFLIFRRSEKKLAVLL